MPPRGTKVQARFQDEENDKVDLSSETLTQEVKPAINAQSAFDDSTKAAEKRLMTKRGIVTKDQASAAKDAIEALNKLNGDMERALNKLHVREIHRLGKLIEQQSKYESVILESLGKVETEFEAGYQGLRDMISAKIDAANGAQLMDCN